MDDATIPAGEFKARCLQLLDAVAAGGAPLTITKRGRPVARLMPLPAPGALFGALAGSVREQQDLVAPIGEGWEADARARRGAQGAKRAARSARPRHPARCCWTRMRWRGGSRVTSGCTALRAGASRPPQRNSGCG